MLEEQPSGPESFELLLEFGEEDDAPKELQSEEWNLFQRYLQSFPSRSLAQVGKAVSQLKEATKEGAVASTSLISGLAKAMEAHPSYISGWVTLASYQMRSSSYQSAADVAEKGRLKLIARGDS